MTPTCTLRGCHRPSADSQVCHGCVTRLVARLAKGRDLADDLTVTISRQDRVGTGGRRSGDAPLPYRPDAAEVYAELRNALSTWVRDLWGGSHPIADTIGDMAEWLAQRGTLIRQHPAAAELVDELDTALDRAERIIDAPRATWPVGACGAGECTAQLYAHVDAHAVRCRECGTRHDVDSRRAWLVDEAQSELLTAAEMARALPTVAGVEVTAERIRQWAHRGRILSAGQDQLGRPTYRVADVRDLATAEATRRANRQLADNVA